MHSFLCTRPDINYIYVAAHGDKKKTHIACPNEEKISPTLLKNDLKAAAKAKSGRVDGEYSFQVSSAKQQVHYAALDPIN